MKNVCIYHNADLDGICSAAIVKLKFPDVVPVGVNYGDDFHPHPDTSLIIIVDFSFSPEKMKELDEHCSVIWIDHHVSSINRINTRQLHNTKSSLRVGVSACELAWRYFFPDKMLPVAVHLLGIYDTWRINERPTISPVLINIDNHWEQVVLPFQYYCRTFLFDIDKISGIFNKSSLIDEVNDGSVILQYIYQQNKLLSQNAFVRIVMGLSAIVINQAKANSLIFDNVYDPLLHDLMITYSFNGNSYNVSFYSYKENVNASFIAKHFGGGGHKGAAGCQISNINSLWQVGKN